MRVKDRVSMLDALSLTGKVCAEIGVLAGDYSAEILKHKPSYLALIDPWKHQGEHYVDINNHSDQDFEALYQSVRERFSVPILSGQVNTLRMPSHEAARYLGAMKFDFIYVDACHNFADVLADMCLWYPKLNSGGWLCGHDYTGHFYGVAQAVKDFCRITDHKLEFVTEEPVWASWGIRVK